jgi:DNA-binding SARP family transcriptional activator
MSYIHVRLLGCFIVTLNGKNVSFPYSKVQALFCYLVVKKQATREELSGLLWPDMEENVARKNLRNAIYKLKKSFGDEEILSFSNKSIITLNPDVIIETDVDTFVANKDEIDIYTGKFLKGYIPKDAENFEEWMLETQEYLEELYLKKLSRKIELEKENKNYNKVEHYCKLLIKVDEFNEEAYRTLIDCYKNQDKFNNAIKLYNELSDILGKELSIAPSDKTKEVFEEVLDLMNARGETENCKSYFYGRFNELRLLEKNYTNFINDKSAKSILIKGEMGIGKTSLKDKFLKSINRKDTYIFETNCYQFENDYALKPWRNIISDLAYTISIDNIKIPAILENIIGNFTNEIGNSRFSESIKIENAIDLLKYDVIGNIVNDILKIISMKKKVLLVFEDIQWMDLTSISLLTSIISHSQGSNITFLITCRNEINTCTEKFFASICKYDRVQVIELTRFNAEEVEHFIKKALPEVTLSQEMINKIYIETEGNTFFLTEYLNMIKSKKNVNIMTSKMQDILKGRFIDMSEDERKIVEISSLFADEVPMFILKELTHKDELQIMDIIEQLEKKCILKEEINGNNICFKFTHQKIREFQYTQLSQGRKRILHNRIGEIFERTLKKNIGDINVYYKLIYHFQNASNYIATLKYRIEILNIYFNFSHELFPVIYNKNETYNKLYFNESETVKNISEIEELLNKVKDEEGNSAETLEFEICVLHIKGRYLIRRGEYGEGIRNIQNMIEKAEEISSSAYAIEGCKQMIYYCIQTNNTDEMIAYINLGLDIAAEYNCNKEMGILLRLKALYKKMIGDYEEAETLMHKSINTLSTTKNNSDQYVLNIAACYNYIGDIRKKNGNFLEALHYYNKAIEICEEKNVLTCLALFQTNAGETAYYIGDYSLAKGYFLNAMNIYRQFDFIWGRAIAEAFMSMILVDEENFEGALKYLKNADMNSKALKNPKEIGTVFKVKAELKASMKDNFYIEQTFGNYLNDDLKEYIEQGKKYLTEARDKHQIDALNKAYEKK